MTDIYLKMHWTHFMFGAFCVHREKVLDEPCSGRGQNCRSGRNGGFFMRLKDGTEVTVRSYQEKDAEAIVGLITRNFREVNVKDYGTEAIEELVATHDVNWFKSLAEYANVYVFRREGIIVGVGSISSFWGSLTESILLTIFVLPELHHQGIGSFIIDTLEADELFLRADRIEIPASITAVEFYRKKGYDYKNGVKELDEEQHYRLEKFRQKVTLRRAGTEDAAQLHGM